MHCQKCCFVDIDIETDGDISMSSKVDWEEAFWLGSGNDISAATEEVRDVICAPGGECAAFCCEYSVVTNSGGCGAFCCRYILLFSFTNNK